MKEPTVLERAGLEHALGSGGIRGALRFLNQRTVHRFTGIYQFRDQELVNLYLYDREDPNVQPAPAQALDSSYCAFLKATNQAFVVASAAHDPRVTDHPKRELIASYCGVPLIRPDGSPYGSLCHFDYRPLVFSDMDLAFMEACAPIIMQWLIDRT